MKTLPHLRSALGLLLGLTLAGVTSLRAQSDAPAGPLNPAQVDLLLGPIALYPDALVAVILPASTMPADIVLAQRYLSTGGNPDQIDDQSWDASVKALARYPMLVKWLDDNLTWTQQLGQTFLNQPDEIMDAVQRLRVRARATGALTSTAQQKVVLDGDVIRIVPAQPDVIYVPYYDPDLVYVAPQPYYNDGPYLTFGIGFSIGYWLSYDFDWRARTIWIGDRHHNWREHGDWDHHYGTAGRPNNSNWHPWKAPTARPSYPRPASHWTGSNLAHPTSLPGAPSYPRHYSPPRNAAPTRPDSRPDSNQSHPPAPGGIPSPRQNPPDNRGHNDRPPAPAPVVPNPSTRPSPSNPPPQNHPDNHRPNDRPTTVPSGTPNPRANPLPAPAPNSAPHQSQPMPPRHDSPVPPAPNHPDQRDRSGPMPNNPPTNRPEPRPANIPTSHQANPPPPRQAAPPPPSKDGTRDNQPEVQR